MAKLKWDAPGQRFFETGVDQGVLYPKTGPGVAWNGLISVNAKTSGGEARPYYIDGVKYLNLSSEDEFEASITAFTYPDEFAVCDGSAMEENGLMIDSQPRQSFGMSYRTRVGNDIDGYDHGYKIHLIYNALAAPSEKPAQAMSDSIEASSFSWDITTTPIAIAGRRPTSHLTIDSRKTDPYLMSSIEELLYGAGSVAPALPSMQQVVSLFQNWVTLLVTDNGDGTWTATGPDPVINFTNETEFTIDWHTANPINETSYTLATG